MSAQVYRTMPCEAMPRDTRIVDGTGETVDIVRVRSVAEYMAEKLNLGMARVDPHAMLGCRIEVL